ncbi:MAG: hypothetical protein IPK12_16390 [Gemmatimonadetes bacterium]|nr:hypothetical protein [Gemmatimonadota bacterium]
MPGLSTTTSEQLAGPATAPTGRPRLLLLSYHFPPGQAPGALRWEKLVRFADERGIGADVLTVHPDDLPRSDASRLTTLPAGTRVFGTRVPLVTLERLEALAYGAYRTLRPPRRTPPQAPAPSGSPAPSPPPAPPVVGSYGREEILGGRIRRGRLGDIRAGFYAQLEADKDLAWARAATATGLQVLERGVHRIVVSCGPPHMPHVAASELAVRQGIPHVMDLRDPWRLQQRLPNAIASTRWFALATRWEERCVARAALVVTNTAPFALGMQALYPGQRDRILPVMNGYDEEAVPAVERDPRFLIAYAGSIYLDRDPRPLFRAGARVIREEGLTPAQIGFSFIGNTERYGGVPVRQIAAQEGIGEFVETGPTLPRSEAMAFLARATLLVSLPQDSDLAIPSKVFEYLNFEAWVLALATPESATGAALAGTSADLAPPDDEAAMAEVLRRRWREFAAGGRPGKPTGTARLARRAQATTLFDALAPYFRT